MGNEEIHILVVTVAMQGHLNPALNLAKLLVSKGLHVTLATTDAARHSMLKSNTLSFTTTNNSYSVVPKTARISLEFFSDGLPLDFDHKNNIGTYFHSLETEGRKNLSKLIARVHGVENKKISCVITNPFMPWMADAAIEQGIPCAAFWFISCSVYAVYYHYFKNPNLFPSSENPNEFVELPGMPVLQVKDLASYMLPSSQVDFRKIISDCFQGLDKSKWILVNSFDEIERDVINFMNIVRPITPVGPLVAPYFNGKEESVVGSVNLLSPENSCLEWLDQKPASSVIYISFGSLAALSQEQMDNLATGLKNSRKPFLWVIRPAEKGCEKQNGELDKNFLEETKGTGLVVTWCSQEKVLMHPAIACFISHCGWSSMHESVASGVPVIAYPQFSEQPINAKFLVDVWKIGVRMEVGERGVASAEEVERCIAEVTNKSSQKIKKRVLVLNEAAKKAVGNAGSSDRNIDQFISEVVGNSS